MSRFDTRKYDDVRDTAREQKRFAEQIRSRRTDVSLTPSQVSAQSTNEETVTVTCPSNAEVLVNGPSQTSGVVMGQAYVSAKDTVKIPFINVTGSAKTPTAGTYSVRVMY